MSHFISAAGVGIAGALMMGFASNFFEDYQDARRVRKAAGITLVASIATVTVTSVACLIAEGMVFDFRSAKGVRGAVR